MPLTQLLKAGAAAAPGAGRLPFLPGGGGEVPDTELQSAPSRSDVEDVAAYARVCGFTLRRALPPTWPHIRAFGLHMALITDGAFPLAPMGLVHIGNEITQLRPIGIEEELAVSARATPLKPHPKGKAFSIVSEAHVGEEPVWRETSTMLRRGGGESSAQPEDAEARRAGEDDDRGRSRPSDSRTQGDGLAGGKSEPEDAEARRAGAPPAGAWWKLPGDLGARYASVSGDSNPIHMHPLTAKPFGFPRPIAHGMWTKARCLAALESLLPDSYTAEVEFGKPILLPGKVGFGSRPGGDGRIDFAVHARKGGSPHLQGSVRPLDSTNPNRRTSQ